MEILTRAQVALLLGMAEKTLITMMARRPQDLPPWFKIPGCKKPFWIAKTVYQHILAQAAKANALPKGEEK